MGGGGGPTHPLGGGGGSLLPLGTHPPPWGGGVPMNGGTDPRIKLESRACCVKEFYLSLQYKIEILLKITVRAALGLLACPGVFVVASL
jgi:hypothetical protein